MTADAIRPRMTLTMEVTIDVAEPVKWAGDGP